MDASPSAVNAGDEGNRRPLRPDSPQPDLRLMIEAVKDYAIFMLDPAGRIQTWNDGAERLKGYSAREVVGRHFSLFYTQEERRRGHPDDELRRAKADGRYEEEGWRVRKDGSRFWANVVITALFDEADEHIGFTKVTRDFTERHEAAEKLRQSEERFRLVLESVRDYGLFLLDPEGRITSWNIGAQRIKGYTAEEAIGQHFSLFYTEEARKSGHPQEELDRALADGSYTEEGWRVRKDGSLFWANVVITALRDAQGRHVGFAKLTRDLTERRLGEERLRESEERLRLLVESVRDYAIFMLDPEGRISTWNTGAQQIKGYRAEEVIGRHFSIFYTPEDLARHLPEQELRIAVAEGRYEEEGWRLRKNGDRFWANVVITAIRDEKHDLRGFAKVTRDLTEKRRAEEAARAAEQLAAQERSRVLQAERDVQQRDEFISVASHELRTPLTTLQLKLDGVRKTLERTGSGELEARLVQRLSDAVRQGGRLTKLVERLLDVTRIVGGKLTIQPEPADLGELVVQVVDDLKPSALHTGSVLTLRSSDSVPGLWDTARLEQVIVNLVTNAIKYGEGRSIDVSLDATPSHARLTVLDHGIGIALEDVDRIFGRFERAVPVRHFGGLGLGLYVSRNIVEAHGGTIEVVSRAGEGSTFVVELPRVTEGA